MERLAAEDAAAGRVRTWGERIGEALHETEPVPEPWPELSPVLRIYRRLGHDANGSTLYTDRSQALLDEGITEPGERDAWHCLWDAIDDELARLQRAEFEEIRRKAEGN